MLDAYLNLVRWSTKWHFYQPATHPPYQPPTLNLFCILAQRCKFDMGINEGDVRGSWKLLRKIYFQQIIKAKATFFVSKHYFLSQILLKWREKTGSDMIGLHGSHLNLGFIVLPKEIPQKFVSTIYSYLKFD